MCTTPSPGSSGTKYPLANFVNCHSFLPAHLVFLAAVTAGHEPRHYFEASRDPEWQAEIDALEQNGTWTIEDLPPVKKPIDSKWVYKVKYNSNDSIERLKARVVVRGDT